MNDIQTLAVRFRKAIDAAHADRQFDWKYDQFHKDRMMCFPFGCCDDTCDLFWHYLFEKHGIELRQISGEYIKEGTNHNWLEKEDGCIIDLTGDQFKGRPDVFVGKDDGFYSQMNNRHDEEPYVILNDVRLKRDYDVIMDYMEKLT